jgi:sugar phosphate isomerase/epimerase
VAKISMNVTTTFYGNVVNDVQVARAAGFGGIELQSPKLYRYLDAGFPLGSLPPLLDGLAVTGVGAVLDIERRGTAREDYLAEVRRISEIAVAVGAPIVQLCTGPVDWNVVRDFRAGRLSPCDARYRGTLGLPEDEALKIAADNVSAAADIAAGHGLELYVEPLAWSNISRCAQLLRLIERVGKPNVGVALDFWHFWAAGDTLEDVAALPGELIKAVQVSDSLPIDREREVPDQSIHRDVVIGGGAIPLQQWIDAVKSTGYDGWYVSEMFSTKASEHDFLTVATTMRNLLEILVA